MSTKELTSGVEESLDGFHADGEAKGEKENTVDKRTENFSPLPSVRVSRGSGGGFGELDSLQCDDQTAHIVELEESIVSLTRFRRNDCTHHVETIGDESERSKRISTDELDEEEDSILGAELTTQSRNSESLLARNDRQCPEES